MIRYLALLIAVLLNSAVPAETPDGSGHGAGSVTIDRDAIGLDTVVDKTELSYDEREAYYGVLQHAGEVDQESLRWAGADFMRKRRQASDEFAQFDAEGFPVFVDMIRHPEDYRGEPVLLHGHVIKTVKLSADPEFGFDDLYECWLVTPNSQSYPLTVVFASNPDGLSIGETLVDGVSVAGYFLKLNRYSTLERTDRFTPLILAHEVRVSAPPAVTFPIPGPVLSTIVLLLFGSVILLVVRSRLADKRFRQQYSEKMAESLPPKFDDLSIGPEEDGDPV